MSMRIILAVLAIFGLYLMVSQITVNAVLPYAYVAGLVVFGAVAMYKHYSDQIDYRFDGRVFWTDLLSYVLVIGLTIQLAGKALTA